MSREPSASSLPKNTGKPASLQVDLQGTSWMPQETPSKTRTAADEAAEAVALAERRWAKAEQDRVASLLNIGAAKKDWEESNALLSQRMAEEVQLAQANQKAATLAMEEAEAKMKAHEMINSARLAATLSGAPQLFPSSLDGDLESENGGPGSKVVLQSKSDAPDEEAPSRESGSLVSGPDYIDRVHPEGEDSESASEKRKEESMETHAAPPFSLSQAPRRGGWSRAKRKALSLFPAGVPGRNDQGLTQGALDTEEGAVEDEASAVPTPKNDSKYSWSAADQATEASEPGEKPDQTSIDMRKVPLLSSVRGQWGKIKTSLTTQESQQNEPVPTDPPEAVAQQATLRWRNVTTEKHRNKAEASSTALHWKKIVEEKQQKKANAFSKSQQWKRVVTDRNAAAKAAIEAARAATSTQEATRLKVVADAAQQAAREAAAEETEASELAQKASATAEAAEKLLQEAIEEEEEGEGLLSPQDRAVAFAAMQPNDKAAALSAMNPEDTADMLGCMPAEDRAGVLESMEPEAQMAALVAMVPEDRKKVLASMTPDARAAAVAAMSEGGPALALSEELPSIVARSTSGHAVEVQRRTDLTDEPLRELFASMDKNQDGTVNRREMIIACRKDPQVREYLGLPKSFKQGSEEHTRFEEVFQGLDADDSREVTIEEFVRSMDQRRSEANETYDDTEAQATEASPTVAPSQSVQKKSRWSGIKAHAKGLLPRDKEGIRSLPGKHVREAADDLATNTAISQSGEAISRDAYGMKVATADVATLQVAQLVAAAKKGTTSDIEAAEQIARIYATKMKDVTGKEGQVRPGGLEGHSKSVVSITPEELEEETSPLASKKSTNQMPDENEDGTGDGGDRYATVMSMVRQRVSKDASPRENLPKEVDPLPSFDPRAGGSRQPPRARGPSHLADAMNVGEYKVSRLSPEPHPNPNWTLRPRVSPRNPSRCRVCSVISTTREASTQ